MGDLTTIQALQIIDQAAQQDYLYHHNGGQAYIRLSMHLDVLMIIDHSIAGKPEVSLHDGREYFKTYAGAHLEHSKRLREHGSLADWYMENYGETVSV